MRKFLKYEIDNFFSKFLKFVYLIYNYNSVNFPEN